MKWKNLEGDTSVFFITATITEWQPLFRHEEARRILLEDLEFYRRKYDAKLMAYVIMPEHYHLVADLGKPDVLHKWLADIQRHTANQLSKWLRETAHPAHLLVYEGHADKGAKLAVWKEQARAAGLTSQSVLKTKIEYVHANPVSRFNSRLANAYRKLGSNSFNLAVEIAREWGLFFRDIRLIKKLTWQQLLGGAS